MAVGDDDESTRRTPMTAAELASYRALASEAVVKARQVADLLQQLSERLGRTDDES